MSQNVIGGKYRLEGVLGSGTFGTVYRASHVDLGRSCAVKLLQIPPALAHDAEAVRGRFLREAKILGRLNHPNTLQIVDFGEQGEGLYIVTELLEGETLEQAIRATGGLAEERVRAVASQLLSALAQAHQIGVVHRDLKPTNVMLIAGEDGGEVAKLLDFGVATAFGDNGLPAAKNLQVTVRGSFIGTPQYAAAEQFGGDANSASDVYAMGLLMWEMITGKPAVTATTLGECMRIHMTGSPWSLPADADASPGLREVVERALQRKESDRYPDAGAMLEALQRGGSSARSAEAPPTLATAVQPDSDSAVVAGKYRLGGLLGAGGFSRVYKAEHMQMQRDVAVKLLDLEGAVATAGNTTAHDLQKRFGREARLVSKLAHPNTITVFDFGVDEPTGRWYIAMEFVDGPDLHRAMRKTSPFEQRRAARVARDMLRSLAEAHHYGILHRDLKPGNVMLTTDYEGKETAKVLDFGIATLHAVGDSQEDARAMTATRMGSFVGTPQYASPEQFLGESLTPASDIYAVGLVLWELLTGAPAVDHDTFGKCLQIQLSKEAWKLPNEHEFHPGLLEILYGALQKSASKRYQSAGAMADDLDLWLQGRKESFQPDPDSEASWEPALDYGGEEPAVIDPNIDGGDVPELLRPSVPKRIEDIPRPRPANRATADTTRLRERPVLELDYGSAGPPRDRRVRPATSDRHAPKRKAPRVPPRAIAIGAAVLVALGLAYSLWPEPAEPEVDVDQLMTTETMHIDLEKKEHIATNVFTVSGIMKAIQAGGWSVRRLAETHSLTSVHQQGYRLSRDEVELEIELITTKSHTIATQMGKETRSPVLAVVFDNKMVRIFPPTRGPRGGNAELASLLTRYRDLVLGDRATP